MAKIRVKKPKFRVGDRVWVEHMGRKLKGKIVEDLGPYGGGGGQHWYKIEMPNDPFDEPRYRHGTDDELELQDPNAPPEPPPSKEEIIDFLKVGGLAGMLNIYTPNGHYQPRVWITRDSLGGLVHTVAPERGLV